MKIKPLLIKTLIATIVMSHSVSAMDNDLGFKVAVIKNTTGTEEILAGKYHSSIDVLTTKTFANNGFEKNTGLCVAYLKSLKLDEAELACSSAINDSKKLSLRNSHLRYLKSISYSNRAVARYINNDRKGALEDISSALLIDNNSIVTANLKRIKNTPIVVSQAYSSEAAD